MFVIQVTEVGKINIIDSNLRPKAEDGEFANSRKNVAGGASEAADRDEVGSAKDVP